MGTQVRRNSRFFPFGAFIPNLGREVGKEKSTNAGNPHPKAEFKKTKEKGIYRKSTVVAWINKSAIAKWRLPLQVQLSRVSLSTHISICNCLFSLGARGLRVHAVTYIRLCMYLGLGMGPIHTRSIHPIPVLWNISSRRTVQWIIERLKYSSSLWLTSITWHERDCSRHTLQSRNKHTQQVLIAYFGDLEHVRCWCCRAERAPHWSPNAHTKIHMTYFYLLDLEITYRSKRVARPL